MISQRITSEQRKECESFVRYENIYLVRSCCAGTQLDVTAAILNVAPFAATPTVSQHASKLSGVNKLDWVVSHTFSAKH